MTMARQRCCTRPDRSAAFTIVELLVVISVIAVLVGLLFPALAGAQRRAKKAEEANRIRQIGIGWNLYANANRDGALPGFLPSTANAGAGESVQERWRVHYRFPDKSEVPAADAEEWPWRLMPYLDFDQDVVLGHLGLEEMSPLAMGEYSIVDGAFDYPEPRPDRPAIPRPTHVAEEPAFGYNGYYVGGWYEWAEVDDDAGGSIFIARPQFSDALTVPDGSDPPTRLSVVVRSAANIHDASKFVLFTSSASRSIGEYHETRDDWPGSHYVIPPTVGETAYWGFSSQNPSESVVEVFSNHSNGATPIPAGRYTNQVTVLSADLHIEPQAPGALVDQRFWINPADTVNFKHTE